MKKLLAIVSLFLLSSCVAIGPVPIETRTHSDGRVEIKRRIVILPYYDGAGMTCYARKNMYMCRKVF